VAWGRAASSRRVKRGWRFLPGKILSVKVEDEMKVSYIDYAMSVIVSRALPDVRDGLKPVHRRILWAMHELGMPPDRPHKKAARVVGEVLGKFHPHGDASVYDAMVRMAQDFSIRYPLVDGHGNFGSIDGDPPAAMRYTEVRLTALAMELLADIRKETVDVAPNFDETLDEPVVLPSRFPNLIVNGSSGIAVGMATNIPPHNLREVIDAILLLIDDPDAGDETLMSAIKGPDFPTAGFILGTDGIRQAYLTGRGLVRVRAAAEVDMSKAAKPRILVTEIPYQVSKSRLLAHIAELAQKKRIDGITDLRDESDRNGLRICIELRRDANPQVVLNRLYKFTALEVTFGIIMLALVDGQPKVLTLRELVVHYLNHQKDVIVRRSRYDLARAEDRAHILEGLRIALDNIDRVVAIIRGSRTVEAARDALQSEFGLSEKQAAAILDMRLQRLVGLEREKIDQEYDELLKTVEYLRAVLASERMVLEIIKHELLAIRDRFGDDRRTRITAEDGQLGAEDLIADEDVVITLTRNGYVKRLPLSTYRSQRRGGRGVTGLQTREEDYVSDLVVASNHSYLLMFTNRGRVFRLKAYEVPEQSRTGKGLAIVNVLPLAGDERVTAVIPVSDFAPGRFLFMATRLGRVKKTDLSEFETVRRSGLIALRLNEGDELIAVRPTDGARELLMVTRKGKALRFAESEVRVMGRTARGVHGMRLRPGDSAVVLEVVQPKSDVLVVTEHGLGKRTPVAEFTLHHRGTSGIKAARLGLRTGVIVGARMVSHDDEVVLISVSGVLIRLAVKEVSVQSREARGVSLMRLDAGDAVAEIARVERRDEENGEG
jgi:DNA gyrase subunit A